MGKIIGVIGFLIPTETSPGVFSPQVTEKEYKGELLQQGRRWEEGSQINETLVITNRVSIIGDDYFTSNTPYIRYVKLDGTKWKITNISVQKPRLILSLGGVYNGAP